MTMSISLDVKPEKETPLCKSAEGDVSSPGLTVLFQRRSNPTSMSWNWRSSSPDEAFAASNRSFGMQAI